MELLRNLWRGHNRRQKSMRSSHNLSAEIIETAVRHFDTRGFDSTSIADICRDINISKEQFHQHFNSLEEILEIVWAG